MGNIYKVKMQYSEESIKRLYKTTRELYDARSIALRMVVGAGLAAAGMVANVSMAVQGILIMVGCWLLVSKDFPAKCAADRALEERKKRGQLLPKMEIKFLDKHAELCGEGNMKIQYDRFEKLYEDAVYIYMFMDRDSACMFEKQSLQPKEIEKFKEFVSKKTKCVWTERKPWYHMNLFEVLQMLGLRN